MPHRRLTAVFVAACAGCGATSVAAPLPSTPQPVRKPAIALPENARVIDLTHVFDDTTLYWPTAPSGFVLTSLHHGPSDGGYFYSANTIAAPEHGGTHLDAPIHFARGQATADAVPLSRLVAPAIVVDMRDAAATDPDAVLEPAHIEAFERAHGPIEPGTIVLCRTGWASRWPDRARYFGSATAGDTAGLHFPGIGEAAAKLLVDRRVAAVGIDTASLDPGPSSDFRAHRVLMAADIPGFENVGSLAEVPARGALVIALPMKIGGGSGGPLRIIAVVPGSARP